MNELYLRVPTLEDKHSFLEMTIKSQSLHHPWVKPPITDQEYLDYLFRYQEDNQCSYLVFSNQKIVGVYNVSEIVRGCFQNAYLGFYACIEFAGKGLMRKALSLVLEKAFTELKLHRLEVNIQPENMRSIALVKSAGFREEGFSLRYLKINDTWRDHLRFALTIEDWQHG